MPAFDSHESYLAHLPGDQRDALAALRARILARLPEAAPCISYAMPAFRVTVGIRPGPGPGTGPGTGQERDQSTRASRSKAPATRVAAGFAAFKRQLGYYPFSGSVVPLIADRLAAEGFTTSKSGVTFTPDRPLPDWALDEMIRLRLAEIG